MNMKDVFSLRMLARMIAPGTFTATQTGLVIPTQGYKSLQMLIDVGIGGITFSGTNNIQFQLQDSPDNVNWTACPITSVIGLTDTSISNGIIRQFTALKSAATLNSICYIGGQAYVQLSATFNGTHGTGTFLSAYAVLDDPAFQPPTAAISSTN